MTSPIKPALISDLGQQFRLQGRSLDTRRLRLAIERGLVPAERVGRMWSTTADAARPFTRPIENTAS